MKMVLAAILILILSSLACGQYVTPAPAVSPTVSQTALAVTETPKPINTAAPTQTDTAEVETSIVRQATVNIHDTPGGAVTGWLSGGDTVTVLACDGDWCNVQKDKITGWVWRGCLTGNDDLGCEAK